MAAIHCMFESMAEQVTLCGVIELICVCTSLSIYRDNGLSVRLGGDSALVALFWCLKYRCRDF